MERVFNRNITKRNLENSVLSKSTISEFLQTLSAEEFDILWDLTDKQLTLNQIATRNGFSISQVNTIRQSLARKSDHLR